MILALCRCVKCSADLDLPQDLLASDATHAGQLRCETCGATFDVIDHVPFIGDYEPEDFIGLIEIVATSINSEMSASSVRSLNTMLADYHASEDKPAFAAGHEDECLRAWWWGHRYHEWLQVENIIERIPLDGARLLNVGAGMGIDAVRLCDAGAEVTCLEYSPMLASAGRQMLPETLWIGGFSHVLPFRDEAFDVVCANAALHHMRSVPLALREMLRVLKPGGWLFTSGDPFRSDGSDDDHEFIVFDRNEVVLGGVNEGMVRVGDIYDTVAAFGDDLDIEILADVVDGPRPEGGTAITDGALHDDRWIPLTPDNVTRLRQCFGGMAIRVHKRRSLPIPAPAQTRTLVSAGRLQSWTKNGTAYLELAKLATDSFVDLPFPGVRQTWFDLLNGWMRPQPPFLARQGFKRARWLLALPPGSDPLSFEARSVEGEGRRATVLVNGEASAEAPLSEAWRKIEVPLGKRSESMRALVEIRLDEPPTGASFDQNCFLVRQRHIGHETFGGRWAGTARSMAQGALVVAERLSNKLRAGKARIGERRERIGSIRPATRGPDQLGITRDPS